MFTNDSNLLSSIIQSAITGYFTYYLIKSNNLLILSNAQREEKIAIVSLLSLFNLYIYQFTEKILVPNMPCINERYSSYLALFISFVIIVFLGLFVLPRVISLFFGWVNKKRIKNKKLKFTNKPVRDTALDNYYHQYIYVFDFDDKYIASGYLNVYQYSTDEYNELLLYAPKEPERIKTIEAVENLYKKYDINIMVDYEKGIKLYIVPMGEVADD